MFHPMNSAQPSIVIVRKCLLPKNCKNESEIRKFLNDFILEFDAKASRCGFVNNKNFLNYENTFNEVFTIFLENPPSS